MPLGAGRVETCGGEDEGVPNVVSNGGSIAEGDETEAGSGERGGYVFEHVVNGTDSPVNSE
jgi:hypothetical protein